jgi:tRNA G46 methylase TrmB
MSSEGIRVHDLALKSSRHLIVEFGMGDGLLLEKLAEQNYDIKLVPINAKATYVGIETDKNEFKVAKSRIGDNSNVILFNAPMEEIVPLFSNCTVDQILCVLPDPSYIDKSKQSEWELFYKTIYLKLKNQGLFRLVTELTDELLEPVSDEAYEAWVHWLVQSFQSLGFTIKETMHSSPKEYTTRYLTQFRGDTGRIRIVTLDFERQLE